MYVELPQDFLITDDLGQPHLEYSDEWSFKYSIESWVKNHELSTPHNDNSADTSLKFHCDHIRSYFHSPDQNEHMQICQI